MLFFISLIIGAVSAFVLGKQGFLAMWATLFNALVSIYLAIMSYPTLYRFFPPSTHSPLLQVILLLLVAAVVFIATHNLVNHYLAGVFRLTSFAAVEKFGARILAFLMGYLLSGFIIFVIGTHPGARQSLSSSSVNFDETRSNVQHTCNLVSYLSRQHIDGPENNLKVINTLYDGGYYQPAKPAVKEKQPAPAQPVEGEGDQPDEVLLDDTQPAKAAGK